MAGARNAGPWPRNIAGFLLASTLLHVAALIVLAYQDGPDRRRWRLRLNRGTNSVALAASVASPRREATAAEVRVLPAFESAPIESRPDRMPEPPRKPAAAFASARDDRRVPLPTAAIRRASEPTPDADRHIAVERPSRQAPDRATPRDLTAAVESVASAPAAESSGANSLEPPRAVRRIQYYPPESKAAGEEGVVRLRVRVDSAGRVVQAEIVQSSGYVRLDRAALDTVYQWRFEPAYEAHPRRAAEFIQPFRYFINRTAGN